MSKKSHETISPATDPSVISVRNYPAKLCREHPSKDGVNTFRSISFMYDGSWASFIAYDDDLVPSVRRDGEIIPNRLDLTLGDPDDVRFVSVKTAEDTYERKAMFNRTILNSITSNRQTYLRSIAV